LRAAVKRLWRKLPHAARQRQTESMGVPWEMTGEAELVWLQEDQAPVPCG
jgi:hypothetical protein